MEGGRKMPDFKKLYTHLFRSTTEAINVLQQAQRMTEGMYIESDAVEIKLVERPMSVNITELEIVDNGNENTEGD
jgi:hypothetical protein